MDSENSIWISNLTPPIDKELYKFVSRAGTILDLIVPATELGECLVYFETSDAASQALTYNGRTYRSDTIQIAKPTTAQLENAKAKGNTLPTKVDPVKSTTDLLKESLSAMDPQNMMTMLTSLMDWAKMKTQEAEGATVENSNDTQSNIASGHQRLSEMQAPQTPLDPNARPTQSSSPISTFQLYKMLINKILMLINHSLWHNHLSSIRSSLIPRSLSSLEIRVRTHHTCNGETRCDVL